MLDELEKLDFVKTKDKDGIENGWVTGVCKDEEGKLIAYQTTIYPTNDSEVPVKKGYHCYRRQTNRLTCVSGYVTVVVYWEKKRREMYLLAEHNPVCLTIPPENPFALFNYHNDFARVINHPLPHWDRETFETDQYSWEPEGDLQSQNGAFHDFSAFEGVDNED